MASRPKLRSIERSAAVLVAATLLAACEGPKPRSFNDFMADALAREGALARCNQDRDANLRDLECANARRAAAAVAVQQERERREQLDRESERKLEEIRRLVALQQQREREAAEAAAAAAEAVYDLQWLESQPSADDAADDASHDETTADAGARHGEPIVAAD